MSWPMKAVKPKWTPLASYCKLMILRQLLRYPLESAQCSVANSSEWPICLQNGNDFETFW